MLNFSTNNLYVIHLCNQNVDLKSKIIEQLGKRYWDDSDLARPKPKKEILCIGQTGAFLNTFQNSLEFRRESKIS